MTKLKLFFLTLFATLLAPALAFAAENTTVDVLPPELFQAGSIAAVATAIATAVYSLIEKFMGPFGWAAKLARLDHVLEGYIRGGLTTLIAKYPQLATQGVSIDVGNEFIAAVAKDVLRVAPGWLIRFAGGASEIEAKIRNRLPKVLQDLKLPSLPVPN